MTTNHHTPIAVDAPANASTFNNPLSQLDSQITTNRNEIVTGRGGRASLDARFDLAEGGIAALESEITTARGGRANLDARLGAIVTGYLAGDSTLQDAIDALIIDSGTSDAETIAARTAVRYVGTAPATLGGAVGAAGGNVINVMAGGDVAGDGATDDTTALQAVFAAVSAGDTIYFPPGKTFVITATLTLATPNVNILGYGATLDATGLNNNTASQNAAIKVDGVDYVIIAGLRLDGPPTAGTANPPAGGITANSVGLYLRQVDHCQVRDCTITGFFRGGIWAQGNYNTVQGNHLIGVRHRAPAYGSIYVNSGSGTVVSGNVITEMFDCGIGLGNCSRVTVAGNYIEGADWTVETGATAQMGINALNGVNNCTITGNTICRVYNEGIILSTGGLGTTADGNTITGNSLIDCWRGINLRAIAGSAGSKHYCRYNTITGNTIYSAALPGGRTTGYGIYLEADGSDDACTHNVVSGNVVSGENSMLGNGIATSGSNPTAGYNSIVGNRISNATGTGILATNNYSRVANNYISGCATGITCTFANYTQVTANTVQDSTTNSINLGSFTPTRLIVTDNMVDRKINSSSASGNNYVIARNTLTGTVMSGVGTLVAGSVTISGGQFGTGNSDAIVELHRLTPASTVANTGALYVSNIEQGSNRITVKSTNASDDGTFYWRIVR